MQLKVSKIKESQESLHFPPPWTHFRFRWSADSCSLSDTALSEGVPDRQQTGGEEMSTLSAVPLRRATPGVCAADVCQSGPTATRGLQQVEAAVDVCPDALLWEVPVLRGHGGQI